MLSFLFAGVGVTCALLHYVNHGRAMGVISLVFLLSAAILGVVGMKRQEKNSGLITDTLNLALLGHAFSSVVLVVCGLMCFIANIR